MSYLDALILGVVEGLTEFLPVSSTGHLILTSSLLGIPEGPFLGSFTIAIQTGAIAAVLIAYWKQFLDFEVIKRLIVAFIPTAVIGFLLYRLIKDVLLGSPEIVVAALALGGAFIIIVERTRKPGPDPDMPVQSLSYRHAALIGLYQAAAIIPGVSRSGATVMGGLLMRLPRATLLTFSFLLAVPTMLAATAYDIYKTPEVFMGANPLLLAVGFISAFCVASLVLRYALAFVKRYSFEPFGWYRLVLAGVFAAFFLS